MVEDPKQGRDNKTVLVTGGAGFLGSFVVEELRAKGYRKIVAPRSAEYDLVDGHAVRKLLAATRPDLILHLAARVGGIGANARHPGRFFYENLMMGVQLIEEARRAGVPKILSVGTVCAYPKFAPVPFREEDLWNGYPEETNAPYGLAKKMLLVQSQANRQEYGQNAVVVFPVNLYGPRDQFDEASSHVIPALIRKLDGAVRRGEPSVTLWGDGTPTREFLYVKDAAQALVLAAERYDSPEPLNLGSGSEIRILDLARLIGDLLGFTGTYLLDPSRPGGQPRRLLEVSRAQQHLGWQASTSLVDGLVQTIDYWRTIGVHATQQRPTGAPVF
jgi:GDP-L-fucose synthase